MCIFYGVAVLNHDESEPAATDEEANQGLLGRLGIKGWARHPSEHWLCNLSALTESNPLVINAIRSAPLPCALASRPHPDAVSSVSANAATSWALHPLLPGASRPGCCLKLASTPYTARFTSASPGCPARRPLRVLRSASAIASAARRADRSVGACHYAQKDQLAESHHHLRESPRQLT